MTDANAPLLSDDAVTNHPHQNDDDTQDSEPGLSGGWFIWILTFSAGISGLLFGYDTGVISSTLVSIGSDLSHRTLSTLDKSLITSSTSLFGLVASPVAGIMADKFGRRGVILIADVLFALGALLQAVAGEVSIMIIGRSIVGLAVGGASLVTPLYISELAPPHARGRLVTILCLLITAGQVVAYIMGWLFSSAPGGWRWIVGLGMVPAVLQFGIVLILPETPRWSAQAGLETDAIHSLIRVYQGHPHRERVAKRVLHDIQREIAEEEELDFCSDAPRNGARWMQSINRRTCDLFLAPGNRRALTIAMMLQGLQQLCGFNSLMYFSATIFSILSFSSPTLAALSVAMTNFLFTMLAFVFIDKIGRRRILLYSIPIMIISLVVCALTFPSLELPNMSDLQARTDNEALTQGDSMLPMVILVCLTVYTASYAFGLGNVPWQQSELFPLNVRSLGSALATATNWGSNFLVGLTFLPMMEILTPGWTFVVYAVICAIGWICVWFIYPELNGLSLEEVRWLLADGWGLDKGHHPRAQRSQAM